MSGGKFVDIWVSFKNIQIYFMNYELLSAGKLSKIEISGLRHFHSIFVPISCEELRKFPYILTKFVLFRNFGFKLSISFQTTFSPDIFFCDASVYVYLLQPESDHFHWKPCKNASIGSRIWEIYGTHCKNGLSSIIVRSKRNFLSSVFFFIMSTVNGLDVIFHLWLLIFDFTSVKLVYCNEYSTHVKLVNITGKLGKFPKSFTSNIFWYDP